MRLTTKTNTQDYHTFGSVMAGRSFNNTNYRFGFNGMEKDNETFTDAYDFGARILDTRIGRWLALDMLMHKYPANSPYLSMSNNPIIFIDVDGHENIIYLIVLPSATTSAGGNWTPKDIDKYVTETNDNFKRLGLDTRVTPFTKTNSANDFDITKIAKTDAVAILGEAVAIYNYVVAKDPKSENWMIDEGIVKKNSDGKYVEGDWVEMAQTPSFAGGKNDLILLNSKALNEHCAPNSKNDQPNDQSLPISKSEFGGLATVHAAGHLADKTHVGDNSSSPQLTKSLIMNNLVEINRLFYNMNEAAKKAGIDNTASRNINIICQPKFNVDMIEALKIRFGEQCPKDEKPITIIPE